MGEFGRSRADGGASPAALLAGTPAEQCCWMSHRDTVYEAPPGLHGARVLDASRRSPRWRTSSAASTASSSTPRSCTRPTASRSSRRSSRTSAAASARGAPPRSSRSRSRRIRAQVGDGRVICGLSGGVDSSVAALLVHRAVGDQLTCVFVDHGLMRKNEGEQVDLRLPRPLQGAARGGRRRGSLPRAGCAGAQRAGGQAQGHRRGVHPRLRGGGAPARRRAATSSRARSTRT